MTTIEHRTPNGDDHKLQLLYFIKVTIRSILYEKGEKVVNKLAESPLACLI